MTPTLNVDSLKLNVLKNIGIDPQIMNMIHPIILSDANSAAKLGITPRDLNPPILLSPNKPASGNNFLSIFSSIMLLANPLDSNNIALFSSAYPGVTGPSVQVEFHAIKPGKKHLVEFNITINEPSKIYKFRVFKYPGNYVDISISSSQIIDVIMDTDATTTFSISASISQQNTVADACGWMLHSVKISSIG